MLCQELKIFDSIKRLDYGIESVTFPLVCLSISSSPNIMKVLSGKKMFSILFTAEQLWTHSVLKDGCRLAGLAISAANSSHNLRHLISSYTTSSPKALFWFCVHWMGQERKDISSAQQVSFYYRLSFVWGTGRWMGGVS